MSRAVTSGYFHSEVIEIDGSAGEGGGQIVRTSVSLSAITGKPVEIVRMRARRERPGLQPQHLAAVRAAASICNATTAGDEVGSAHLLFEPRDKPQSGEYVFDIRTAGAATLVLQTVLVPLLLADGQSVVEVIGGTHQPMSPAADYLQHVYVPAIHGFGASVEIEYGPAGYYPRGGGRVRALIGGSALHAIDMTERASCCAIDAYIVTSRLPEHVAERGASTASQLIDGATVHCLEPFASSAGASATIVARHGNGAAGFSSIGRPGLPMENVVADACAQYDAWVTTDAACDEHLGDQLVLPACVAPGTSRWTTPRITDHLSTVLSVVRAFLPVVTRAEGTLVEVGSG